MNKALDTEHFYDFLSLLTASIFYCFLILFRIIYEATFFTKPNENLFYSHYCNYITCSGACVFQKRS